MASEMFAPWSICCALISNLGQETSSVSETTTSMGNLAGLADHDSRHDSGGYDHDRREP
jgi:hypothetical protein